MTKAAVPVVAGLRIPVWLMATMLMLVTIALYWPAMRCVFINLDDPDCVTENFHVQSGLTWAAVKWAFSDTQQHAYWAPLTWLSHMLVCQFFGLNPWAHHLLNVLLHAANTVLVFLVFQRMTRAPWRSLMLAALFGWHPLRVESVAWVTEREDVLSTLFWMLTLLSYAKYVESSQIGNSKSKVWYGTAMVMFLFGLMSKAMLVSLPFVLLLLDYWPLERFKPGRAWQLVREKIPFLVLAAVVGFVTFVAQKQGGAVKTFEYLPFGARVGNGLISYCRYMGKTFWPTDLAVFYPHPGYWPLEQVALAGIILCGILGLLFVARRRYPYMLVGWLWFVGTLVPVIGLVQVGGQAMADRFTYVPSLGVLILTIWGAYELAKGWRFDVIVMPLAGAMAIVVCIAMTRQQLGYWKDSETIFRHTAEVTKNNYIAYNNVGAALLDKGQTEEAMGQFQEAIRINPEDAEAHYNLGVALFKENKTDAAVSEFREAIRIKPDYAEAHNNLGTTLLNQGQTFNAASQFQEATRLKPDFAQAHFNLGVALFNQGKTGEAASQFQEAVRLKPDYVEAHINLGTALLNHGQTDGAISQFQEAVRLKPDDAEAHYNLGVALLNQGQTDGAVSQFQEAIRLEPDAAYAQSNLAKALELKSKSEVPASGPVKPEGPQ